MERHPCWADNMYLTSGMPTTTTIGTSSQGWWFTRSCISRISMRAYMRNICTIDVCICMGFLLTHLAYPARGGGQSFGPHHKGAGLLDACQVDSAFTIPHANACLIFCSSSISLCTPSFSLLHLRSHLRAVVSPMKKWQTILFPVCSWYFSQLLRRW